MNQAINRSTNQTTTQSINQPTNRQTDRSTKRQINQPNDQSIDQPIESTAVGNTIIGQRNSSRPATVPSNASRATTIIDLTPQRPYGRLW